MPDLNEEILKLKGEGMNLRQIGTELKVSHMTVRRRLKTMDDQNSGAGVTGDVLEKDKCNIPSKPLSARISEESRDVEHHKALSHRSDIGVTGRGNPVKAHITGQEEGVSEVSLGFESLFEAIKEFLESKGVELYRMHVEQEGYQAKNNGQVVRLYVQRNNRE